MTTISKKNQTSFIRNSLVLAFVLIFVSSGFCQSGFETKDWLKDDLTISFNTQKPDKPISASSAFSGIRLLFEPSLGGVIQTGSNKVSSFTSLAKGGVEFNLRQAWISLQVLYFLPSTVTFDQYSPIVTKNLLVNNGTNVNVNGGFGVGLSFVDGLLAIGYGRIYFDDRQFKSSPDFSNDFLSSGFVYINLQPVSTARKVLKLIKGDENR